MDRGWDGYDNEAHGVHVVGMQEQEGLQVVQWASAYVVQEA